MTSRERILNTVRRQPVDRVPVSLYELSQFEGSTYASFANSDPSYRRLLDTMREKTDCIMQYDPVIVYPGIEKVTERICWAENNSKFTKTILHTPKGDLTSLTREDDNIFTVWVLEHFLKEPEDIDKYCSLDFTCHVDTSRLMEKNREIGNGGVICPTLHDPLARACSLFSMEDFLICIISETEEAMRFMDFLWALCEEETRQTLSADVRDMMFRIVGAEYATPPYLPDRYFSDFVTRYIRKLVPMIHDSGAISRVHSHGQVRYALSELVSTGVMCIDPVEAPPDGNIALSEAKALYGDSLVILGNIQLKNLEQDTPEQIDRLVQDTLRDGKPGGGFILMPTATPINTPLSPKTEANLLQFIESACIYGKYN